MNRVQRNGQTNARAKGLSLGGPPIYSNILTQKTILDSPLKVKKGYACIQLCCLIWTINAPPAIHNNLVCDWFELSNTMDNIC